MQQRDRTKQTQAKMKMELKIQYASKKTLGKVLAEEMYQQKKNIRT